MLILLGHVDIIDYILGIKLLGQQNSDGFK
jgi:hypothetical protein